MANVFEGPPDARQSDDPNMPTSRFRPRYRALSDAEVALHDLIKAKAQELEALYRQTIPDDFIPVGADRCHALALTNLEVSVFWAIKALTA